MYALSMAIYAPPIRCTPYGFRLRDSSLLRSASFTMTCKA